MSELFIRVSDLDPHWIRIFGVPGGIKILIRIRSSFLLFSLKGTNFLGGKFSPGSAFISNPGSESA